MTLQKLAPAAALSVACLIGLGALGLATAGSPQARKKEPVKAAPKAEAAPKVEAASGPAGLTGKEFLDYPAFAVRTDPPTGSVDVDPALAEVRVTWSREMTDKSWTWSSAGKDSELPIAKDSIRYEKDRRTCVASVKLEPGKTYAVYLNSPRFTNFRDAQGRPAVPYLLVFKTRAAK